MDTDNFFDREVKAVRPMCRRKGECTATVHDVQTDTYSAGIGPGYRADIRYTCLKCGAVAHAVTRRSTTT